MTQHKSKKGVLPSPKELGGSRARRLLIKGSLAFTVFLLVCAAGLTSVILLFWDSHGPVNWSGLLTLAAIFLGPVFLILGTPLFIRCGTVWG
jgi:hypothetical protein